MSEKARIRWMCRRGMKELDVLLERFIGAEYDGLDTREHNEFVTLIEREDPDLYYLVMGRSEPENDLQAELLARIRRFTPPGLGR